MSDKTPSTPVPDNTPTGVKKVDKKMLMIAGGIILTIFLIIIAILLFSKNKTDTNDPENTDNPQNNSNSYPTDVCPDEIIYGSGSPIGIWDGVEYEITSQEDIDWLDRECKDNSTGTPVSKYSWTYNNDQWVSTKTPPATCDDQIIKQTPVDINLATAILYPGQTRNLYKAHGGFIFGNSDNDEITVKMPMDAKLVNAARYIESGEVQYLFSFLSDCGIAFRFDHLLTLSSEFQEIADTLPEAAVNNTQTTDLTPVEFKTGTTIATAVGFKNTQNVSVDFGVYDYRQKNEASEDPAYAAAHKSQAQQTFYGVCWLDLLPQKDIAKAKALPGGDGKAGKQSDYCE
jgi:hypothetical protein